MHASCWVLAVYILQSSVEEYCRRLSKHITMFLMYLFPSDNVTLNVGGQSPNCLKQTEYVT